MKTSIWYHTSDRQPDKTGYYLAYRTPTLADDSSGLEMYWWNKSQNAWSENSISSSPWVNVYYWTESNPSVWVDTDPPVRDRPKHTTNPALAIAWQRVEDAISNYELIRALSGEHAHDD